MLSVLEGIILTQKVRSVLIQLLRQYLGSTFWVIPSASMLHLGLPKDAVLSAATQTPLGGSKK